MNPLVSGLFDNFRKSEELFELSPDEAFELFAAHLVLGPAITDQANITDFLIDKGAIGVDVALIDINGTLAFDSGDVHDLAEGGTKLDVTVHLIQAKRSPSIDSTQILGFGDAALQFLENRNLDSYPILAARSQALQTVFADYAAHLKGKPAVNLHFVTTSPLAAVGDTNVTMRSEAVRFQIDGLPFVSQVQIECIGADAIHDLWALRTHANEVEVQFQRQMNLPEMPGIDQAILGVVSAKELVNLVRDRNGNLDERIFYDNVRGFQGSTNIVNESILGTLASEERQFVPVLNNGITVVARSYSPKPGDTVSISDYQIVNGCQTSHCIFLAIDDLGDDAELVFVPLRLVVTSDDEVANRIIRATNSQTPVDEKDLVALTKFQKRLEDFYRLDPQGVNLTYERRPGQFFDKSVTKTRLVTTFDQMRAIAAFFLDEPHAAARYASRLYEETGDSMFRDDHQLIPYVASAFAAYRLENAFRTVLDTSYKSARYHILMVFKYLVLGGPSAPLNSLAVTQQSEDLIGALRDTGHAGLFREAAQRIEAVGGGEIPTGDRLKRQQFSQELKRSMLDSDE